MDDFFMDYKLNDIMYVKFTKLGYDVLSKLYDDYSFEPLDDEDEEIYKSIFNNPTYYKKQDGLEFKKIKVSDFMHMFSDYFGIPREEVLLDIFVEKARDAQLITSVAMRKTKSLTK